MAVNQVQLQKYLGRVDSPIGKNELIRRAQANGADNETVNDLRGTKADRFDSPADMSHALYR
jgi:hypothetical protein